MNEKKEVLNYFLITGFIVYLIFLIWEFIFQDVPPGELFRNNYVGELNFVPYAEITASNVFNQIILFIPLGLFLCIHSKRPEVISKVLVIFLASLFLEFLRLLFLADFDITTTVDSVIGGILGIIIYKTLIIIFKDEEQIKGFVAVLMTAIIIILSFSSVLLSLI